MRLKKYTEYINEDTQYLPYDIKEEYMGLRIINNELILYLTTQGRRIVREEKGLDFELFWELYEGIQNNSDYLFHINLGEDGFGLTDAPGISFGYIIDRDGQYEQQTTNSYVFYYKDYMYTNFIEELESNGRLIFTKI